MDGLQDLARVDIPPLLAPIPRPARKAILVLGMSRSGTSLLTHTLHALGAALPGDVLGAEHGNPLGHYEPHGLVTLNDSILQSLDRGWDDPRPIPARWFRSRSAYQFLQRVIVQIRQSYGEVPLLVLKDPRLCRLLPLYLDALDILDIEPLVILQMRPVAEVVQSLVDRNSMHPDLAEFLWLRSVVEAELQSRTCRRVWTSMAEMFGCWPDAMGRIADGLGLKWPIELAEAMEEIASLRKPRLWHRVAPVTGESNVGRFSADAWAAAEHGLAGDEPAARAGFDPVRRALDDLDRMYEPYLAALQATKTTSWSRWLTAPLRALRRG
ncbi:MAG: hypothetical protein ABSC06_15025 [Rhodopila sp.]|jgi:hypothetical protein